METELKSSFDYLLMPPPRFACSHTIRVLRAEVICRRGFTRKDYSCLCDYKKFYKWFRDGVLVTQGRSLYEAPYELKDDNAST